MKNLKIKFGLFSLLAVLVASVFLTSCEQDILDEVSNIDDVVTPETTRESFTLILPYGYNKLSEEEIDAYISSLDFDTFNKLAESREVIYYFKSLDKLNILEDNAQYGDIFDRNTLEQFLTPEEVTAFQSFDINNAIELRECGNYSYSHVSEQSGVWGIWYYCYKYDVYVRDCDWWCVWCNERDYRNRRGC